jgi:hypothetical protein
MKNKYPDFLLCKLCKKKIMFYLAEAHCVHCHTSSLLCPFGYLLIDEVKDEIKE